MNFKAIFLVSIIGPVMGVLSIMGWIGDIEPLLWLAAMVIAVVFLKKNTQQYYLWHGVLSGVGWGIGSGLLLALFFDTYLKNNPEFVQSFQDVGQYTDQPQLIALGTSLITGLFSGALMGIALIIWNRVGSS